MQEQLVYLIGNAFRIYIYFKLLNTMFGTAKVKQIWIIIGFTFYFLINSFALSIKEMNLTCHFKYLNKYNSIDCSLIFV